MKKITLLLIFLSQYGFSQPLAQFYQNTPVSGTDFGYAVAVFNDDMLVSTSSFTLFGPVSIGKVYLFNRVGGIHQTNTFYPDDAMVSDNFGSSIAIGDDFIAIGAPYHDAGFENAGAVYLYHKTENGWQFFQKLLASDASANVYFGGIVKISGNFMFVKTYEETTPGTFGSVYVYIFDGTNWLFSQKLLPGDNLGNTTFANMDVQDDTLVISNYDSGSSSFTGLEIFKKNGNNWEFHNTIPIGNLENLVHDFSLSDDHIYTLNNGINGETYFDDYVQDADSNWTFVSSTNIDDHIQDFTYSIIEAAGNHLFFGATAYALQTTRKFPVLHYVKNGGAWLYQNSLYGTYDSQDDYFGSAMASQGNHVVIGAPYEGLPLLTGRAYYLDTALATTQFERKSNILFPNPTSDIVSINSDAAIRSAEVWSVTGKLLFSEIGNVNRLSLEKFANGIYFVKLKYKNASEQTFKIIKN